ncbi:uncharacterized protein LOC129585493 [Paramacrobiotus metropolitanus]|uniref:uncharacterized protein LOC129585493 n=1 Tax=Paramacrobiotus metropolitanus TaxID=2943436 RepID=UPI002445CDB3|nr:uncharacterized protein LOC129585493 [Paramacrobiotus metropolitanus]
MLFCGRKHSVSAWNAVDVRMKSKKLKHGHVINKAKGGLIIDFGCDKQRAKFIKYERISHCNFSRATHEAEVLLQSPTSGAWIWYPGQVITMGEYRPDYAQLVEVQLPDRTVRELFPMEQVRQPPTGEDLRGELCVWEDHYLIRSCKLPGVGWAWESHPLKEVFKREVNKRFGVVCTNLSGSAVYYLQDHGWPVKMTKMKEVYCWAKKEEAGGFNSAESRWVFDQNRQMRSNQTSGQRKSGKRRWWLPAKLLVEIFQSLDSIERFRCRRVCSLWNRILAREANFPDVCLSARDGAYSQMHLLEEDGAFWVAAGLLKCLNSRTRVVVVTGLNMQRCTDLAKLIQHIRNASQLPTLVFCECSYGSAGDGFLDYQLDDVGELKWIVAEVAEQMLLMLSCCDRILWKECTIVDYNLTVPVAQLPIGALSFMPLERQLWEFVKAAAAESSDGNDRSVDE